MIRTITIRNIKERVFDETWIIVRSLKQNIKGATQIAQLSPSSDLFFKYLDLKKQKQWNQTSFDNIYVPSYLQQIRHDQQAIDLLNYLYRQDKAGKNICLACFCTDEDLCHRSIVAGLLQGVGAHVKTDTGKDYTEYYEIFKNIS